MAYIGSVARGVRVRVRISDCASWIWRDSLERGVVREDADDGFGCQRRGGKGEGKGEGGIRTSGGCGVKMACDSRL